MKIVKESIDITELKEMAKNMHGNLVKAMVDVQKEIIAIDAPLHADVMEFLIEQENCESKNLWGINFYPDLTGDNFIEFDSMMNLKPALGNMTRGVGDQRVREKIKRVVEKIVI